MLVPVMLIELLTRIEVSAANFAVELVRVRHTDLLLECTVPSVLHESISPGARNRARQN